MAEPRPDPLIRALEPALRRLQRLRANEVRPCLVMAS